MRVVKREQAGEVSRGQALPCGCRVETSSCWPRRVPGRFLSDIIRCVLQKVHWVCEEDELSVGPVDFEEPAGRSSWDRAEAQGRGLGWRPGVEIISVNTGSGAER